MGNNQTKAAINKSAPTSSPVVKNPLLIICPMVIWGILVFIVLWPWIHQIDKRDPSLSAWAHVSAFIWWLVLLWGLHHLFFQVGALFKKRRSPSRTNSKTPLIAVLYATRDDFDAACCFSCLDQDYKRFSVFICDDSDKPEIREQIDNFEREHSKKGTKSKCEVLRRGTKRGFKAGNLNDAINKIPAADWILLIDADQVLTRSYISDLVGRLPQNADTNVAFVQAAHSAIVKPGESSYFQQYLSPEVSLYYVRDLSLRNACGFVPLLGHGAMISKSAWSAVGGFPEVVSEDFAFAIRIANEGLRGEYVEDIVSKESFPHDFGGFTTRLKKFAAGTAELWRHQVIRFLIGKAHPVEKWDFLMMLLWYALMPLVTVNGFLGAYVCHRLWVADLPYLHPMLPYLYSWMIIGIFILHVSIAKDAAAALRFYFWSTAIYTSAMPVAGWSFLKHFFVKPQFERTPKNQEESRVKVIDWVFMIALGVTALTCSVFWYSPFTPVLFGQGAAYLLFPLYAHLCKESRWGALARKLVYVPGLSMIVALYAMWTFGLY
jgi:cellulose synthase/poly-beta-1,6-N-acetylglucosamine synthase-like glycosyltransferase